MSAMTDLLPELHCAHAFQLILVLMTNRIFFERSIIAQDFATLCNTPVLKLTDFLNLLAAFHTASIMFNIIAGKWAFDGFDDHVPVQLTDTLQSSVSALPFNIQSELHTAVSKIKQLVSTVFS